MRFKVCLIGCGDFAAQVHGAAHVNYANNDPSVELAACCDLDGARAKEFSKRFCYRRFYTDMEAMMDQESPDVVIVLVMPQVAAKVASSVLRRGTPFFLEKPPGMNLKEIDDLIAIAAEYMVPNQVAFNRRYMPLMRRAREIIEAGLNPIQQVNYNMIRYGRDDPDFSVTAIHAIDAAMFLAGSPYRKVSLRFEALKGVEASRSNFSLLGECESGTSINIHVQPMAGYLSEYFSVHGVGVSLFGEILGPGLAANSGKLEHWVRDKRVEKYSDVGLTISSRTGIDGEFAAFCDAVRSGAIPTPSLEHCWRQVRLMEAVRNRETDIIDFSKSSTRDSRKSFQPPPSSPAFERA